MQRSLCILLGSAGLLAGCNQDDGSTSKATVKNVQPEKKRAYCFFKDDELKGWKASRDASGNLTITGKGHVNDPRYKAVIGQVATGPQKVIVYPTIGTNDTGFATPDNWWDIKETAPNSVALNEVAVSCGDKIFADLKVPPKS